MKNELFLILGANGLIGQQFVKQCAKRNIETVGTCFAREGGNNRRVNFQNPEEVQGILDEVKPSVVVNCVNLAGGVNVVENNPEQAHTLHVKAVQIIADWCRLQGVPFIFFSTDYVFDGQNPPYKEGDAIGPLNMYGKLKLESEQYIGKNLKKHLIIRTTNVFGWDPDTPTPNFLMYLFQTLKEGKSFNAPSFLWGNPTHVSDLVSATIELLDQEAFGLFHVVGSGYIDRYSWALKFCQIAGLDKSKIIDIKSPPENIVPRPLLSNLNTDKVRSLIKTNLHGVDEGLQLLKLEMISG